MRQGWLYLDSGRQRGRVLAISDSAFNDTMGKALVVPVVDPDDTLADRIGGFYVPLDDGIAVRADQVGMVDAAGWEELKEMGRIDFGVVIATVRAILGRYGADGIKGAEES